MRGYPVTQIEKSKLSRAYGRNYIIFDRDGREYASIKGRMLDGALRDAKMCGGEIWLKGRCVVPAWNVV